MIGLGSDKNDNVCNNFKQQHLSMGQRNVFSIFKQATSKFPRQQALDPLRGWASSREAWKRTFLNLKIIQNQLFQEKEHFWMPIPTSMENQDNLNHKNIRIQFHGWNFKVLRRKSGLLHTCDVSPSFPKLCKVLLSELTQANSRAPTLKLFALSIVLSGRSVKSA